MNNKHDTTDELEFSFSLCHGYSMDEYIPVLSEPQILFLQNAYGVSPALRIHRPIPTFSVSLHPLSGIVPKRRETYSYIPCLYC